MPDITNEPGKGHSPRDTGTPVPSVETQAGLDTPQQVTQPDGEVVTPAQAVGAPAQPANDSTPSRG